MRTILELSMKPFTPGANDSYQIVDAAIGVISREAFAANAIPDANVAGDSPTAGWVWRIRCMVLGDTAGALTPTLCRGDFRSARKLDDNGNTFMILNNTNLGGSAVNVHVAGIVRCLYLMP